MQKMKSNHGKRRNCSSERHVGASLCGGKAMTKGMMKTKHLAE
jgi:hypothetical protein